MSASCGSTIPKMTLPVTEEQLQALRARMRREQAHAAKCAAEARAYLPQIVRTLVERYGATRVVLFGSLARGDFDADSDIDIAADNLAGARLYRAMGELSRDAPFWVDLKPLDELPPDFCARAFRTSEVLYDRAQAGTS